MSNLKRTAALKVSPSSTDAELLLINPNETIDIDFFETVQEFQLYTEIDDFINATENWKSITIRQEMHEVLRSQAAMLT